uniref:Uncharacterized protein n=1 Tax=Rhizophora mucronata TaxID=61149 RepID=A0A2P2R3U4_RHIMU
MNESCFGSTEIIFDLILVDRMLLILRKRANNYFWHIYYIPYL